MKKLTIEIVVRCAFLIAIFLLPLSCTAAPEKPPAGKAPANATKIAAQGQALMPIVVSESASPRVQKAAATLAQYLTSINGGTFNVQKARAPFSDTTAGLVLGLAADFEGATAALQADDPTRKEDYRLRNYKGGVQFVGVSELAVEHAVWDFFYRLGYRQFFPGEKWEIVPKLADIAMAVNVREHPDYLSRRIWYGFGSTKENMDAFYETWWQRNRVVMGIDMQNSHEYASIIMRNKAEFTAHPEYYAMIKGQRAVWDGAQVCVSNVALRRLVVADALRKLEKNPKLDSISVEPNDGGGWCECAECAKVGSGSVSDRVVTLANDVAAAVAAKYPGKFVGMLAYNEHSPPPTIQVHPNVVVSIATAFIRGGYTVDQLIDGWSKQATVLGIYDYYSFFTWDWDNPGAARAGSPTYVANTALHNYERGARFISAESSNNWGPNGLGYYVASRVLWDTEQAKHVDDIVADFLEKSFGPARAPMKEWYRLIDGARKPLMTTDLVGRMYGQLNAALQLTDDAAIRARIYDLALYTRWVEMVNAPQRLPNLPRDLLAYSWRIRATNMMHTLGHWSITPGIPAEAGWGVPEPGNPWKNSTPYTPAEIEKMISDGIAANPTVSFVEASYSHDLVPATPLGLTTDVQGDCGFLRGSATLFTWIDKAPATIAFPAQSGVSTGPTTGRAKFTLFAGADKKAPVAEATLPRDNQGPYNLKLAATRTGLHRIDFDDATAGTRFTWPVGTPLTFESGPQAQHAFQGKWTMYFYVPKGTKVVGGYRVGHIQGKVVSPQGQVKLDFTTNEKSENNRDYWSVPVGPGQDGLLWKLQDIGAVELRLMNVPPYLARSAAELLLPREVVERDAGP